MSYQLCKEFPAFTPLQLESERYHVVIGLYANVRKVQIRNGELKAQINSRPNVIRRPAGDNWF